MYRNARSQKKQKGTGNHQIQRLLAFITVFMLVSLPGCGAFAAGLTHAAAARVFLSYANDITDWEEHYYTGEHPDDGDGVTLDGYVNGKKFKFGARSYYYGLATISLQGNFNDLKPNWGKEYVFTEADSVYLCFLWTLDDLGIIPAPEYGDPSSVPWGPYGIYDIISSGRIDSNYSKTDWPSVEISKGHMTLEHANGAFCMFDVQDDGDFLFFVALP